MKKIFLLFFATISCLFNLSQAQIISGSEAKAIVKNAESIELIGDEYLPLLINFSAGEEIELSSVQTWVSDNFKMPQSFGLKLIKAEKDQFGFTHYRYQQTYNSYPVVGGDYIAHVKDNKVVSVSGKIKKTIETAATITLSESDALQNALNSVNASIYKWQISGEEKMLKYIKSDANATYYPKGELMIIPEKGDFSSNIYHLAYRFDVYAVKPLSRQYIFIDANTGDVITTINRIETSNVQGTAVTKYSGSQNITTDNYSGSYRLRETGRGNGIETYDMNTGTTYTSAVDFTDADNNWNNVNTTKDEVATDAHWGAEKTYDYYYSKFGRNSLDNNGFKLLSYVHFDSNYDNAYWDGTCMTYGDGDGTTYTPFTALDICGHEITHGLTENTANLTYSAESGALNEGFSDVFGTCIEWYAKPSLANWNMGENIGTIIRSMANPNDYQQPDTYNGTNWVSTSSASDNGGVHTNSGVLNYWFYLLCKGGSGTNDNGNAYSVNSIGMDKAAAIAYRTLTYYLTSSSNYANTRTFSIQSCNDLYPGSCSPELIAVTNAWYAVGIGAASTGSVSGFTSDKNSFCTVPATIQFTNQSTGTTSYKWNFGDGTTSTLASPSHTYIAGGNYNVKLVTYGGSCGTDSITKISFINIDLPSAPVTTGDTIATAGTANLSASGTGTLNWYDAASGGNLVNTGTAYSPSVTATTTYYVQDNITHPVLAVGKASSTLSTSTGGYYTAVGRQGLVFDVLTPLTINSVTVYENVAGSRTIWLRNSSGTYLDSLVTTVAKGTQTITLNFTLPAGTGYVLGAGVANNFWRENSGTTFPYTVSNLISITGNTVPDALHYYYFYNWQIQQLSCTSERAAVTAVIEPTVGINEFSETDINIFPNPSSTSFDITFGAKNYKNVTVSILNVLGETLMENKITDNNPIHIDVTSFHQGIYFVKLETEKSTYLKKVTITK
jgi:Zn-dependent metalloprotease